MIPERSLLASTFLAAAGWGAARRTDLAGDASMRRYERLCDPSGKTAILMDAPPDTNADITPFVTIARYLNKAGLSAPFVYSEDSANGFLVLEDLGDDLFARVIPTAPHLEQTLYMTATEVLVALHRVKPPILTRFSPAVMAQQAKIGRASCRERV